MAVFGVGNIGHRVCHLATLLGMQVVGVDPVRRHSDVVYMSPDDALAEADIIVCAMNLTQENHGYFTLRRLQQTRKSPLLINIARGEFTPAAVLRKALEDGHLSGIGLDVYNDETTLAQSLRSGTKDLLTQDNLDMLWLHKQPQCICTPHNAFNTAEAVERKSEQTIRSMQHYRREGAFLWPLPE